MPEPNEAAPPKEKPQMNLKFNPELNISSLIAILSVLAMGYGAFLSVQSLKTDVEEIKKTKLDVSVYEADTKSIQKQLELTNENLKKIDELLREQNKFIWQLNQSKP